MISGNDDIGQKMATSEVA